MPGGMWPIWTPIYLKWEEYQLWYDKRQVPSKLSGTEQELSKWQFPDGPEYPQSKLQKPLLEAPEKKPERDHL